MKIRIEVDESVTDADERTRDYLPQLRNTAQKLPDGHLIKIVWDKEGGYPEHAWGYTQYTVRPYRQGYGCDGTTDSNIHLIALDIMKRLGLDYATIYREAYQDENPDTGWIEALSQDKDLVSETLIPEAIGIPDLILMLSDLYQINNRTLVATLENHLMDWGIDVSDWYLYEDSLRSWKNGKPTLKGVATCN